MKDPKIRTLEEVCEKENFIVNLLGNFYCGLAVNKKINCSRQAKEKDQNGCYSCLDLRNYPEKGDSYKN